MLANPRGFCAGVERAIEIVERLLAMHGAPIYVKHEVVHNRRVVEDMRSRGVVFIEDPATVPAGSILVFSAHGVSQAVRRAADAQQLVVHDATCPLVTKVHAQVVRMRAAGRQVLMIGHAGHPEVEGTMGQVEDGVILIETAADAKRVEVADPNRLSYVSQTTLSVDETRQIIAILRSRFPAIEGPAKDDICYATQNRQDAVKEMAANCDLVLVVGSVTSSNSNRLREVAQRCGAQARLLDDASQVEAEWLQGCSRVGITAGASAPEEAVQEIVARICQLRPDLQPVEGSGIEENVSFAVPRTLLQSVPER